MLKGITNQGSNVKSAFHGAQCVICRRFYYAAQRTSQPGDFTLVAAVPLALHPEKFSTRPTTTALVRRYFADQDTTQSKIVLMNPSYNVCCSMYLYIVCLSRQTDQFFWQGYIMTNIRHKSRTVTKFSTGDVSIRLTSPFIHDQFIYHILPPRQGKCYLKGDEFERLVGNIAKTSTKN